MKNFCFIPKNNQYDTQGRQLLTAATYVARKRVVDNAFFQENLRLMTYVRTIFRETRLSWSTS